MSIKADSKNWLRGKSTPIRSVSVWTSFVASVLCLTACSAPEVAEEKETVVESSLGLETFQPRPIGMPPEGNPWITDIAIGDVDRNGWLDIIACDGLRNEVTWLQQLERGVFKERVIGQSISGPAHVEIVDLDLDGDADILVASMGVIFPNNDPIGSIIVLEQTESGVFANRLLVEKIARVTDVQAGDLDGDGDLDLMATQFGYFQGETRWLQNLGEWNFKSETLQSLPGGIHCPITDFDGDGDLDSAVLISQEWEEIHLFANDGSGTFERKRIYGSTNEDYGSSGLSISDLDGDGDHDVLYTNGDGFDYATPGSRPWHGVQWLENKGDLQFQFHRLGTMKGAYSPISTDIDNDGDNDIVVVSCFNEWQNPKAISLMVFENDGQQNFVSRILAHKPTHLVVVKAADMDGDGQIELITGSFHAYPPYENMNRVILWDRG